jgi:5-formyltetrahydrofolate cyclo-ligase
VALAFELQIAPEVPADAHDIPMHMIVTEKRVIDVHRQ